MNTPANVVWIDNQTEFDALITELIQCDQIALDTEFERRNTYFPRFALLQLGTCDGVWLVDPFNIDDWSLLKALFASDCELVMHACSEDIEVFHCLGVGAPSNLIDTQIACAFLGIADSLGYAAMVARLLDRDVDKSETRSDWLHRPLTQSQLRYAAADVHWLLPCWGKLKTGLNQRQRLTWFKEECQQRAAKAVPSNNPEQWLRLKGVNRLESHHWPLAQALFEWREELAQRLDKPRSWLLKDQQILEIVRSRPNTASDLAAIAEISEQTLRRNGQAIMALVDADLPPTQVAPLKELESDQKRALKQLQEAVQDVSYEQDIAVSCLANKQDLHSLILNRIGLVSACPKAAQGWRKTMLASRVDPILEQLVDV